MEGKVKVLLAGDVEGKFSQFFSKIENTNKKSGPFDLLLCVGNFFGATNTELEPYCSGGKKIPIPTYILGPNKEEHITFYPQEEAEICENLYYLGKRGQYIVVGGLKVAYLSGITLKPTNEKHIVSIQDIVDLKEICRRNVANYKGVDILLTSEWPEGITGNSTKPNSCESSLVSWVSTQINPRYHVSGLNGIFYERPPYRTSNSDVATRFIGLAKFGNSNKQKWLYAINLTPLEKIKFSDLLLRTTDETENPFDIKQLETKVFNQSRSLKTSEQFFYDMSSNTDRDSNRRVKRPKIDFDQEKCWFCLASPQIQKHLIITVGSTAYLAAAKGGLVDEHMIICPIEHFQNSASLKADVLDEIQSYKETVRNFYFQKLSGKLPIFFERNFKTSHMQIHAVPISEKAAERVTEVFKEVANANGFELDELDTIERLTEVVEANAPYFFVELPSKQILYTKIKDRRNFPIEFAREVLASRSVLNMKDRIEWKQCILPVEEETELVTNLRKKIKSC